MTDNPNTPVKIPNSEKILLTDPDDPRFHDAVLGCLWSYADRLVAHDEKDGKSLTTIKSLMLTLQEQFPGIKEKFVKEVMSKETLMSKHQGEWIRRFYFLLPLAWRTLDQALRFGPEARRWKVALGVAKLAHDMIQGGGDQPQIINVISNLGTTSGNTPQIPSSTEQSEWRPAVETVRVSRVSEEP